MSIFTGVNGKAKEVKEIYVGVGGKAKKVAAGFVGVNGKAKQFYTSGPPPVYLKLELNYETYPGVSYFGLAPLGSGTLVMTGNDTTRTMSFNASSYTQYTVPVSDLNALGSTIVAEFRGNLKGGGLSAGLAPQDTESFAYLVKDILTPLPVSMNGQSISFFGQCTQLTSIPADLFVNCPDSTSFASCFMRCVDLTSIPSALFDPCTKATSFTSCFNGCTSLTGPAPELWDTTKFPNVTTYSACFRDCTGLSNYADIPDDWK